MYLIVHAAAVEERAIPGAKGVEGAARVLRLHGELVPARGGWHSAEPQRGLFLFSRLVNPLRIRMRDDPRLAEPAEVPAPVEMPALCTEAQLAVVLPCREQLQSCPAARFGDDDIVFQSEFRRHRRSLAKIVAIVARTVKRIEPAAQLVRRDPERRGHRVGQNGGGVAIDRTAAEKQCRGAGGGRREFAQPGALDRPDQVCAIGFQRPILLRHRFARPIGEGHSAQRNAIGCFLHRLRRTVAALKAAARLIHRKGESLGGPRRHRAHPWHAFGRKQGMRLQRAISAA